MFKVSKAFKGLLDHQDRKVPRDFREYPVLTVPQAIWVSLVSLVTQEVPALLEHLVTPETLARRVLRDLKGQPDQQAQTARTGRTARMRRRSQASTSETTRRHVSSSSR